MTFFKILIAFFWIFWLVYWLISAVGAKKNNANRNWWKETVIRIAIIFFIISILKIPIVTHLFLNALSSSFYSNILANILGTLIFLLGFSLAIWARVALGKNWGMPMTTKKEPELVMSGPYVFIRHPIYTGVILAMLGTLIAVSIFWIIPFIFLSLYFIYSLHIEEKNMLIKFPKAYKEYKKHTKALIPFIY